MSSKKEKLITLRPGQEWRPNMRDALPFPEVVCYTKGIYSQLKGDLMCMRNYDDAIESGEFVGYRTIRLEVPGENREYVFRGELFEFRGVPCEFRIDYCDLETWDDEGNQIDKIDVTEEQIPFLWSEAERLAVEEWDRLEYE